MISTVTLEGKETTQNVTFSKQWQSIEIKLHILAVGLFVLYDTENKDK